MHARAARGGDHDEGALEAQGVLDGQDDLLARAAREAAAQEAEVHDREHDARPRDVAAAGDDGLADAELLHRRLGLRLVRLLRVAEVQRIGGNDVLVEFPERAGVDEQVDALAAPEAVVKVAFGADLHVRRPFVLEDVGLAGGADLPDVGRQFLAGCRAACEPSHGVVLSSAPDEGDGFAVKPDTWRRVATTSNPVFGRRFGSKNGNRIAARIGLLQPIFFLEIFNPVFVSARFLYRLNNHLNGQSANSMP